MRDRGEFLTEMIRRNKEKVGGQRQKTISSPPPGRTSPESHGHSHELGCKIERPTSVPPRTAMTTAVTTVRLILHPQRRLPLSQGNTSSPNSALGACSGKPRGK